MNHVYRVVFNHSLGVYQCVSELAKSRGKSSGKSQVATKLILAPLAVAMLGLSGTAMADVTYDDGATTALPSSVGVDETLTVTNDSTLTADVVAFGYRGTGALVINTGKFNASETIALATEAGSKGSVKASGTKTAISAKNLTVGEMGTGDFIAEKGAKTTISDTVSIGLIEDSIGTVSLSDDNTSLNTKVLGVGNRGKATFKVEKGADVNVETNTIIGNRNVSNGNAIITDQGSTLTSDTILVGNQGTGNLIVKDGANIEAKTDFVAGVAKGSNGTATIIGPNTTAKAKRVLIGNDGTGLLSIEKGAKVTGADVTSIGTASTANGELVLTNAGSALSTVNMYVGDKGTGVLKVSDGAQLTVTRDLFVGGIGGDGTAIITDGAKINVDRAIQIGGRDTSTDSVNATGTLTVNNTELNALTTVVGAFGSGTLNLNNSVIKTENIERFINSKKSEVNFDGGTLQLTALQPVLFNNFTGDNTIKLGAGGGTFDTAGFDARLFEDATLAGNGAVITGTGGFTKAGMGSLTMATTAKQWTGATNVNRGMLQLNGDYTMRDGEILGIGLNSIDDYGQLVVKGNADISKGTLQVNASQAVLGMEGSNEWKDVVKATALTGKFDKITDNSPLVDFEAIYDSVNTVNLKMVAKGSIPPVKPEPPVVVPPVVVPPVVLPPVVVPPVVVPPVVVPPVVDTSFAQSVLSQFNRNDLSLAYVLDRAIQDRVANGNNDLADDLISSTINFNQSQLAAAANQLQPLFMGATNRIITDTNFAVSEAVTEHRPTTLERNLWAKIIGNNGTHEAENGITGYETEGYGAIVGLDTPISSELNLGVAVSYINTDANTDDSSLDHDLTAKNWQILGYGNYAASEATNVNFHAGAGSSDVKGERNLSILTNAVASSDYSVDTLQAGVGVGHRIGTEQRHITPFAQFNYAQAKSDSYQETGAGVYNLNVDENKYESMRWTAGLRMSQLLTPRLALTGQLAAAIENGDKHSDITASFIGMPNDRFTTVGQEVGREIGIAGIGLSYTPTANMKISADYRGEWRDNYDDQGASIALQTTF